MLGLVCFPQVVQKQTLVWWELEQWFNSQLYQKYFCQKLLKSASLSLSYSRLRQRCFFQVFCVFQGILCLICVP